MSENISEKAQSPIVLPPETLSQNWISKRTFDSSEDIIFSFEPKIITGDKEATFGVFLVDSLSTKIFGGTTIKGGLYDYSTKGEIGEGLDINGQKYQITIDGQIYDLLLDHVYPNDEQDLVNNQKPFNYNGFNNPYLFSIFFDSTKNFYKTIIDNFGNQYFDPIYPINLLTNEIIEDIDTLQAPMLIQVRNQLYVVDMVFDGLPLPLLNFKNYTVRFILKDNGRILNCSLLKPNETNYNDFFTKEINANLNDANNLRLGFGITSPVISYDKNKKAADKPADLLRYFTLQGSHLIK